MEKLTKEELKTPDQFWLNSRKVVDWVLDRMAFVLAGLGIVLVGIVATLFIFQSQKKTEGKAQYHYSLAKSYVDQWKLQNGEEKAKTAENVEKELKILEKDFTRTRANQMAELIRAEISQDQKKYEDAIKAYERFAKSLPSSERAFGLYPLAEAYENQKLPEKALKTYEDILKTKAAGFESWALLGKARSLKALQKMPEAEKAYQQFLDKHPQSPEAPLARALLAEVAANTAKPEAGAQSAPAQK